MKTSLPNSISVIVVNWNVADSLARCLASIRATKYPNLEIIVIDNASEIRPKFVSIQNATNIGLPRAWNQGLEQASGDYILVLNPDTRLPKDFFTKAISYLESHPDVGILSPKFLDPDGTPQGSVFPEPSVISAIREYWLGQKGAFEKYVPQTTVPISVNSTTGACLFFSRQTLKKVGPFTEKVFMYFEDHDFCRRVRQAGLKIVFHPDIQIIHEHGQSSRQTQAVHYRYLIETAIYPLRKLLNLPNTSPSSIRYLNESAIWYNGWLKQLIIALILRPFKKQIWSQ